MRSNGESQRESNNMMLKTSRAAKCHAFIDATLVLQGCGVLLKLIAACLDKLSSENGKKPSPRRINGV